MLIIDTDPGVDDSLALLLTLSLKEKVDLGLVSLTYGNCSLKNATHNLRSLFNVWQRDLEYRKHHGIERTTPSSTHKPIIAAGAVCSLDKKVSPAANVHGSDGLGGVHSHPDAQEFYLEIKETLQELAATSDDETLPYKISELPAHVAILDILRKNEPNTVTICAVGPLTNVAMAIESDRTTFARVKQLVVMGGAVQIPGNVSPFAEFNFFCDSIAASYTLAHSALNPQYTIPQTDVIGINSVQYSNGNGDVQYYAKGETPINIVLFPLDITLQHNLNKRIFDAYLDADPTIKNSPLARWMKIWMSSTFEAMSTLSSDNQQFINLHDPLAVFYAIWELGGHSPCLFPQTPANEEWTIQTGLDLRVEYQGKYTNGAVVRDLRTDRPKLDTASTLYDQENWLYTGAGNRVNVCTSTPVLGETFGKILLSQILGLPINEQIK